MMRRKGQEELEEEKNDEEEEDEEEASFRRRPSTRTRHTLSVRALVSLMVLPTTGLGWNVFVRTLLLLLVPVPRAMDSL